MTFKRSSVLPDLEHSSPVQTLQKVTARPELKCTAFSNRLMTLRTNIRTNKNLTVASMLFLVSRFLNEVMIYQRNTDSLV